MKKNKNTYFIAGIIALIILIGLLLFYTREKKYAWYPQFRTEKNEPYDLSLFRKTISASYSSSNYREINSLLADTAYYAPQNGLLIYIDDVLSLDSLEMNGLKHSVSQGNKVFVSTHTPKLLMHQILNDCDEVQLVKHHLYKNIYPVIKNGTAAPKIFYQVREDIERSHWLFFNSDTCDALTANVVGTFEAIQKTHINFIELPYGEGAFYIHLTPLIFTNFHFKNKPVFDYATEVFDAMPHEKLYYFIPKNFSDTNSGYYERPYVSDRNILQFIMHNPPLKWAWYLILGLALLYVFNSVRRKQNKIPVFQLPQNEISNYLDVVSRLYQKEGNHKHILEIQEKLIFEHLRHKYRLNLVSASSETFEIAAKRLQMEILYLKNFFQTLHKAKYNSTLTDKEFKTIIERINEFYKQCP